MFMSRVNCDGDDMQIKCDSSQRIAIYSAMFGRELQGSIDCPTESEHSTGKRLRGREWSRHGVDNLIIYRYPNRGTWLRGNKASRTTYSTLWVQLRTFHTV